MIRQIKYFLSVVQNNSFSEAAEECHISQSAISQQIKALENELGFQLLERKNRKFIMTAAGEYFYKKCLILISDYEQICRDSAKIACGNTAVLKIGFLRNYSGQEFKAALEDFSAQYPYVSIQLLYGNHEELFSMLRSGTADFVLNDQRRAFSEEYVNLILTTNRVFIEISSKSPLTSLKSLTPQELKNIPCILISAKGQREIEREYYQTVMGFQGDFLYASNLEEARLMVISRQGFMPFEGKARKEDSDSSTCHIPLYLGNTSITRNYCLFWKKDNSNCYIEKFAHILKNKFNSN